MKLLALTVLFSGIVSHVTLPSKETVTVLPKAPQHTPHMCVRPGDLDGSAPSGALPPDSTRDDCPAGYFIPLDKVTASFSNIDESAVTATTAYTDSVISLGRIAKCSDPNDVRDEVKKKEHDTGGRIASYVTYPGGEFGVNTYFKTKGFVDGHATLSTPQCYACVVSLTMKTMRGGSATITLTPKTGTAVSFKVKASAIVAVTNGVQTNVTTGHVHWLHHYQVLKAGCASDDLPEDAAMPCDKTPHCKPSRIRAAEIAKRQAYKATGGTDDPSGRTGPDLDVECSNTRYP